MSQDLGLVLYRESADLLTGWTVYKYPLDYPLHYVVRQWWVIAAGELFHYPFAALCGTLEEAREQIPAGAIRFAREPEDDASIEETWM